MASRPGDGSSLHPYVAFLFLSAVCAVGAARVDRTREAAAKGVEEWALDTDALIISRREEATLGTSMWSELISWSPRVFHIHNMLTEEECDHLMALSREGLERSTVMGEKGQSIESTVRTSKGVFVNRLVDPIVKRIENRVAQVSMLPVGNQEDMQILYYQKNEEYKDHPDFFDNPNAEDGYQRVGTMLMYLTNVTAGGETHFKKGVWGNDSVKNQAKADKARSKCATDSGISVRPDRGDAVFFYSLSPNNHEDKTSLHASCPVTQGEKWSATKWIHVSTFRRKFFDMATKKYQLKLDDDVAGVLASRSGDLAEDAAEGCVDMSDKCNDWYLAGDCPLNEQLREVVCCKSCASAINIFSHIGAPESLEPSPSEN